MLSTTETAPRGIAVENTLPRFRPERVYYSGCRPFLEGWLGSLSRHHLSFLVLFCIFIDFLSFPFERNASLLAFVFYPCPVWARKKHRKRLTKKKGVRREQNFSFVFDHSSFCYSQYLMLLLEKEKSMKERPTESSYLITVYCCSHTYQIKTTFSSCSTCLLSLRFEHIDDGSKWRRELKRGWGLQRKQVRSRWSESLGSIVRLLSVTTD